MSEYRKTDAELREQMLQATMAQGFDRDEAEVIMARVAGRLGGYTHEEVEARHPMPPPPDRAAGGAE